MIITERKLIHPVPYYDTTSTIFCDICGVDLEEDVEIDDYDENEATLSYKDGPNYPEEDMRVNHIIDICHLCMKNKVFPLLEKEYGCESRDVDYW